MNQLVNRLYITKPGLYKIIEIIQLETLQEEIHCVIKGLIPSHEGLKLLCCDGLRRLRSDLLNPKFGSQKSALL